MIILHAEYKITMLPPTLRPSGVWRGGEEAGRRGCGEAGRRGGGGFMFRSGDVTSLSQLPERSGYVRYKLYHRLPIKRHSSLLRLLPTFHLKMVVLCQSQTFPINPPGAEPVLSVEQFWDVLEIKCRQPELFVKPIASSSVLEETQTTIKREAVFREVRSLTRIGNNLTKHFQGMGPPGGPMIEDLVLQKPWKVSLSSFPLPRTHSTRFSY